MMMIYDKKNKTLFRAYMVKEEYELVGAEIRILELLLDYNIHSTDEIMDKCNVMSTSAVITQISRMRHKGLDIQARYGRGYKLMNNIIGV